jgi:hypothetical protein
MRRFFLFLFFSFLNVIFLFSQKNYFDLPISKNQTLLYLSYANSDNFFYYSAFQSDNIYKNDIDFTSYNSNFNKRFHITKKQEKIQNTIVRTSWDKVKSFTYFSYSDKFIKYDQYLLDEEGNEKEINFFNNFDSSLQEIEPLIPVFSDEYLSFIGPLLSAKNNKNEYKQGEIFIKSISNIDSSETFNELELPNSNESRNWQKGQVFTNYFYLFSHNEPNEERNVESIIFCKYNHLGKLLNTIHIDSKLLNFHFISTITDGLVFNENYESFLSYSSVIIDNNEEFIYVSGFYSDKPSKSTINGEKLGFYVNKFDILGNLVWGKVYPLNEKLFVKNNRNLANLNLETSTNNVLNVHISDLHTDRYFYSFVVDTNDGEIINSCSNEINFKSSPSSMFSPLILQESNIVDKNFKNFRFDLDAYKIMLLSKDFNSYLQTLPSNIEFSFLGFFLNNGDYSILQRDYINSNFKILIF